MLLHALLVGVLPFQGKSMDLLFEAIKTVKLDFHGGIWESISGPVRDLLGRMLTRDASKRITADEVLSEFCLPRSSCFLVVIHIYLFEDN